MLKAAVVLLYSVECHFTGWKPVTESDYNKKKEEKKLDGISSAVSVILPWLLEYPPHKPKHYHISSRFLRFELYFIPTFLVSERKLKYLSELYNVCSPICIVCSRIAVALQKKRKLYFGREKNAKSSSYEAHIFLYFGQKVCCALSPSKI